MSMAIYRVEAGLLARPLAGANALALSNSKRPRTADTVNFILLFGVTGGLLVVL